MIKKIIMATLLISLLLVMGCSKDTRTSKEKAQERVLYELRYCDNKFDTGYETGRQANKEYCSKILELVEKLIYEGWFETDEELAELLRGKEKVIDKQDVSETVQKEVDALERDIIGDI